MMPCNLIRTPTGAAFICGSPAYKFGGFIFEVHSYGGPHPLRKRDLAPYSKFPGEKHRFWDAWEKWNRLDDSEKEKTRIDR